jgi:hypothetical protein
VEGGARIKVEEGRYCQAQEVALKVKLFVLKDAKD